MDGGYSTDLSTINTSDLTEDERASLEADLEALFQPRGDLAELTKDLQIIAEQQLGETPRVLAENIKKLRTLLEEEENLNARTDDLFLAAFLRGRKHDVEKAFQCVKNFYDFKTRYPDLYSFIYPSKNPEVYDQQHFGSLPGTDKKGRKICAIIPGHVNTDIPLAMNFRMGASMLEMMLMDRRLQVAGTVIIFDMGGFSLRQQAALATPTNCWHLAMIVQVHQDHFDLDIPMCGTYQMAASVLELMLMDVRLQIAGTCLIFDMAGLSLVKQARLITPTLCWHMAISVQDKIPMRLKAIHIINQPFYFNAIHAIFKRLLKKKLRKRMFLHGNDMESLHKHISPEHLPEEWGGTRPPFTSRLTKTLLRLNEHKFDEWKDKGYKS